MQCPQCAVELGRAQIICDSCGAVVSGLSQMRPMYESLDDAPEPVSLQPQALPSHAPPLDAPQDAAPYSPPPLTLDGKQTHATPEPLPFASNGPSASSSAPYPGFPTALAGGFSVNADAPPVPPLNTLHWLSRPQSEPASPAPSELSRDISNLAETDAPEASFDFSEAASPTAASFEDDFSPEPADRARLSMSQALFPPEPPQAPFLAAETFAADAPLPESASAGGSRFAPELNPSGNKSRASSVRAGGKRFRSFPALAILTVMILPAPIALVLAWTSDWPRKRKLLFTVFNVGFVLALLAGAGVMALLLLSAG